MCICWRHLGSLYTLLYVCCQYCTINQQIEPMEFGPLCSENSDHCSPGHPACRFLRAAAGEPLTPVAPVAPVPPGHPTEPCSPKQYTHNHLCFIFIKGVYWQSICIVLLYTYIAGHFMYAQCLYYSRSICSHNCFVWLQLDNLYLSYICFDWYDVPLKSSTCSALINIVKDNCHTIWYENGVEICKKCSTVSLLGEIMF